MIWIVVFIIAVILFSTIYLKPISAFINRRPWLGILIHGVCLGVLCISFGLIWQLTPIYLMGVLLMVEYVALVLARNPQQGISKRVNGRLALVLYYMTAIMLLIFPLPDLNRHSGDFEVGNWRIVIESNEREETFKPDQALKRRFAVRMYYPVVSDSGKKSLWLEGGQSALEGIESSFGIPTVFISHLKNVTLDTRESRKMIDIGTKSPVVILSHGLKSSPDLHVRLAQTLASKGYFVAVINHTYSAYSTAFSADDYVLSKSSPAAQIEFVDQRINAERMIAGVQYGDIVETIKALDSINQGRKDQAFANRLDLSDITLVGHQIGGGAGLVALNEISFIKAAVLLNPIVEQLPKKYLTAGVNKPFTVVLTSDYKDSNNAVYLNHLMASSLQDEVFFVPNGSDFDFTDGPLLSPLFRVSGLSKGKSAQNLLLDLQADIIEKTVSKHSMGNYFKTIGEYVIEKYPSVELIHELE